MKVIFGNNLKPQGVAIRLKTWSEWQHGGVVIGDKVIEALAFRGVVATPLKEFEKRYRNTLIVEIPHRGDYQKRAYEQVGKPYDWAAILGFIFRRSWANPDKWFCFELIAYCSGIYNPKYLKKITSNHLLMLVEKEL